MSALAVVIVLDLLVIVGARVEKTVLGWGLGGLTCLAIVTNEPGAVGSFATDLAPVGGCSPVHR